MVLIDVDGEAAVAWTPTQEALAAAVAQAVKKYITTTEYLSNNKYAHLKVKIPEYLAEPGNILMAICADGVVIRYEKRSEGEPKRFVSVFEAGIAEAAAMLSQNIIHIESDECPKPTSDTFGVEIKLTADSPSRGTSRDILVSRIWLQARSVSSQQPNADGAKPYCLLSARNNLDLQIHGELYPDEKAASNGQPFIARRTIRLAAGWECIEVFPGVDPRVWNADFAALWAESDLLGAALISQTKDAQLSNLDPRASTRRLYSSLLNDFKKLLDSDPDREQVLQTFLQANPILLCPTYVRVWPKLQIGAAITDFVFCDANQEYFFVELERSTLRLFRNDGHCTAELTHALGQIVDWKRYLEDNLSTVQNELGLSGITPNPSGLVVIGRSQSLLAENRRKLRTMTGETPRTKIMTYDDVYENAKAVFENLLGPMWDPGGATTVFYPASRGPVDDSSSTKTGS